MTGILITWLTSLKIHILNLNLIINGTLSSGIKSRMITIFLFFFLISLSILYYLKENKDTWQNLLYFFPFFFFLFLIELWFNFSSVFILYTVINGVYVHSWILFLFSIHFFFFLFLLLLYPIIEERANAITNYSCYSNEHRRCIILC